MKPVLKRREPLPLEPERRPVKPLTPVAAAATERPKARAPTGTMGLQKRVGNQTVTGLVQRQAAGESSNAARRPRRTPRLPDDDGASPALGPGFEAERQAPASVQSVVAESGRPLPELARRRLEQVLGHDLSDVRVHTDTHAARAAHEVAARAFTVNRHVVFGAEQFAPDTPDGMLLLAHELVHVIQQRANGGGAARELEIGPADDPAECEAEAVAQAVTRVEVASQATAAPAESAPAVGGAPVGRIQRAPQTRSIAQFEVGNTFTDQQLRDYLAGLDARGKIEDHLDSDDKARAIVERWIMGRGDVVLPVPRVILLIKEMQCGFTGDDDEMAILELLERSGNEALRGIFARGAIDADDLNSDFHGSEWDHLQRFYQRRFRGGMAQVLEHHVDPVGEPVPLGVPLGSLKPITQGDEAEGKAPDTKGSCGVKHPELCPTYEEWLHHFTGLPTFKASSQHRVLGGEAAPAKTATDIKAGESERRPPALYPKPHYMPGDRFIDGPTEKWVRDNLPPNLVETAYQLPSDCADLAVILRHVWLAAHHLEEDYKGWHCGSTLGLARAKEIGRLITEDVTENVGRHMLNPYSDEAGQALRDYPSLEPLLHPGDVLVWHHRATGSGHVQTIMHVERVQGKVDRIDVLQGNQPIGRELAESITGKKNPDPAVKALRAAPGRRIEVQQADIPTTKEAGSPIWNWADDDRTFLVLAGPPGGIKRPEPAAQKGQPRTRRITDWIPVIRRAGLDTIDSAFESVLLEVRTTIERRRVPLTDDDAQAVGQAAGDRLRALVREASDLQEGGSSLFRLERMRAQAESIGEGAQDRDQARRAFGLLVRAFVDAARGISSVDFSRQHQPTERMVNVMLTGFDPFNPEPSEHARPVDWNPSGVAVRQLDGESVPVESNVTAAVEGVVLPVSYDEFKTGMVESLVEAHRDADAILTVSLYGRLAPDQPVRLEQFAAGVHAPGERLETIPPAKPGAPSRPAIFEARGDTTGIAAETAQAGAGSRPAIPRPTIGTTIKLEFTGDTEAREALAALGEPPQPGRVVEVSAIAAVRRIASTMQPDVAPQSPRFTFRVGPRTFGASLVEGPGGNYLSNEVTFRVLRRLSETGAGTASFHVHTPRGTQSGEIPQANTTPEEQRVRGAALSEARSNLAKLVLTLRRLIAAVARRIAKVGANAGGTPTQP